jgi:hypothetical protein
MPSILWPMGEERINRQRGVTLLAEAAVDIRSSVGRVGDSPLVSALCLRWRLDLSIN